MFTNEFKGLMELKMENRIQFQCPESLESTKIVSILLNFVDDHFKNYNTQDQISFKAILKFQNVLKIL